MKKKNGANMIELLIILAIIGILVAIIIPEFLEAIKEAENRTKKQTTEQVEVEIEMNVDTATIMNGPNAGTKVYWVNDVWSYKSVQFVDYGPESDEIPGQIILSKTENVVMDPNAFKPDQGFPVADAEYLYMESDGWNDWLDRFRNEVLPAHNKEKEDQEKRSKR